MKIFPTWERKLKNPLYLFSTQVNSADLPTFSGMGLRTRICRSALDCACAPGAAAVVVVISDQLTCAPRSTSVRLCWVASERIHSSSTWTPSFKQIALNGEIFEQSNSDSTRIGQYFTPHLTVELLLHIVANVWSPAPCISSPWPFYNKGHDSTL